MTVKMCIRDRHNIAARCISPKDYSDREQFADAMIAAFKEYEADLIAVSYTHLLGGNIHLA